MQNKGIPSIDNYKINGAEFVEITNNVGMTVVFTNLGAAIHSIKYMGELMTSQAKEYEDFFKEGVYNGKTIGRVAGRIEGSHLIIDNKTHELQANEEGNVLHGGKGALSNKMFSCRVFNTTEHVHVVYTYFSSSKEAGFPGNALFEVHYIVSNNKPKIKNKLLSYVTEKCPISLTNHTYFSLGEKNLKTTKLTIKSSRYLDINSKTLILGEPKKVTPALDFRETKPVLRDIDAPELNKDKLNGYDHCFLFDVVDDRIPQITMENNKFKVDIYTDFDSVVVYTENYDGGLKVDNSDEKVRRGIAIEPQLNPNSDRLLKRGDEFSYYIRYEFAKK